jgi:hypothetical protein
VCQDLGPADPLRRTVRRRAKLVQQRITSLNRLTALLDRLGPGYNDAFGDSLTTKTGQAVLSRYADPRKLLRTPRTRWCRSSPRPAAASTGRCWSTSSAALPQRR